MLPRGTQQIINTLNGGRILNWMKPWKMCRKEYKWNFIAGKVGRLNVLRNYLLQKVLRVKYVVLA